MIGTNKIELNQATICEAVEEYLNKRLQPGARIKVSEVKESLVGGQVKVYSATVVKEVDEVEQDIEAGASG